MTDREMVHQALTKVPAVALGFWIIRILATTLRETGRDSVLALPKRPGKHLGQVDAHS